MGYQSSTTSSSVRLPASSDGAVLDSLYREANVLRADYGEQGIESEAVCDKKTQGRLKKYLPELEEKEEWML